jgi:tRNA(fMet)-specific endonuclease VapC
MAQVVPLSDAKARLAGLVQAAEAGQVVHISRHGRPVAVLLSEQAYAALHAPAPGGGPGQAIELWRLAARSGYRDDWPLASDPAADQEVAAWRDCAPGRGGGTAVNFLLDTHMLSEPLREHPHPVVMEQLQRVVIHELSYGVQRLPAGRKRERLAAYLQGLLESGLPVLAYDGEAALWHGQQRARLEAEGRRPAFADGQIAAIAATNDLVLVTRNLSDFTAFQGLQLLDWFSVP